MIIEITPTLIYYDSYYDGPLSGLCEYANKIYYFKCIDDYSWQCSKCNRDFAYYMRNEEELKWLYDCWDLKPGEQRGYNFDNYKDEDFCDAERYFLYDMCKISKFEEKYRLIMHNIFLRLIYNGKSKNSNFKIFLCYNILKKIGDNLIGRWFKNHTNVVYKFHNFKQEE